MRRTVRREKEDEIMRTRGRDSAVMDQMEVYGKRMRDNEPREKVCDQSYIKQFNIQSVLATLRKNQPISRTDIARMTGMSPTSITRIVTALLNQELIDETSGEQRAGRGRKATNLRVNADGLYSLGIHLEPSKIRLCVMNFADETLYRGETLVDGECTPEKMAGEARRLYDRMPDGVVGDRARIGAVGVCLSGTVNRCRGIVNRSMQMHWENLDIRSCFAKEFGRTVCVENDVKACLIGEKVRMGIADEVNTSYILIDRGVGMASTSGGVLIRGVKNEAGEIGMTPIGRMPDGSADCFSRHLGKTRLIELARAHDPGVHSVDAIRRAAEQGCGWAQEIVEDFRKHLELLVSMADGMYNPARIILGGGVCGELYPDIAGTLQKEYVELGDQYEESCMTGAALIAMRQAVVELIGQTIE